METFHLDSGATLQGDFTLGPINLLLVFQVNCPGCFIHALPFATELYERHAARGLQLLALSTACEDFELNTLENTSGFGHADPTTVPRLLDAAIPAARSSSVRRVRARWGATV